MQRRERAKQSKTKFQAPVMTMLSFMLGVVNIDSCIFKPQTMNSVRLIKVLEATHNGQRAFLSETDTARPTNQ